MTNSRLLQLLRTFSPAELTAFGKYLRSPLHNQRGDVRRLFGYLFQKMNSEQALAKEVVFHHVFPKEKEASESGGSGVVRSKRERFKPLPFGTHHALGTAAEKKLAYAMSFLLKCVEAFLVQQAREQAGAADFQLHLAKTMRQRNLQPHFETAMKKAGTVLKKQPHRNGHHHRLAQRLHSERYGASARQRRSAAKNFQEMADETTAAFVVERLRQGCTAHVHRAVSEADYRLDLLPETLALVEQRRLFELPAVGLYYFGYRALSEEAPAAWFGKLRGAMRQHFDKFPKAEMRDIYTLAVNCCIRQINTQRGAAGHELYLRQVFEIYQEGLENQVFTDGGVLSHFTYKNIANAGLGLKAFDWVEAFLHRYRPQLEARHRDSAFLFNLASLHFRKSEYGKVLELLAQAEFEDVLHQLDARRMLLRSYFERGEFDALDSLLDSFRIFLRRRRDVGYLRQNYLNLIRFTQKLLKIPASDRAAREKLRQDILQTKALAEREWLVGKT